jgi:hypothetical protein
VLRHIETNLWDPHVNTRRFGLASARRRDGAGRGAGQKEGESENEPEVHFPFMKSFSIS